MKAKVKEASLADYVSGRRKVKDEFFRQINIIMDWSKFRPILEKAYTKGGSGTGRPCYDCLVLYKIELVRTWYGMSDPEVEENVNDRISFSRFVGIGLDESCPDSTTICRFRNDLVAAGIHDELLNETNRQLEAAGVIVVKGALVDASVTRTPRRPRGRKEYEVVEDRHEEDNAEAAERAFLKEKDKPNVDAEARWVKKNGLEFGYKRHTVTNEDGLVLAEVTTSANESDITHLEAPLDKVDLAPGTPVYADKGYSSANNRDYLARRGLKCCIMHRATSARKLTVEENLENREISKVRYAIERTFGSMRSWFRAGIARYVGLDKMHAQHIIYRQLNIMGSKTIGNFDFQNVTCPTSQLSFT